MFPIIDVLFFSLSSDTILTLAIHLDWDCSWRGSLLCEVCSLKKKLLQLFARYGKRFSRQHNTLRIPCFLPLFLPSSHTSLHSHHDPIGMTRKDAAIPSFGMASFPSSSFYYQPPVSSSPGYLDWASQPSPYQTLTPWVTYSRPSHQYPTPIMTALVPWYASPSYLRP
ncbi:hypothetical protein BJX99DRAFT_216018 [Aspergillus californicus]